MKISELLSENMDHSKDGRAVEELKGALENHRAELRAADDDQVYDIIDKIMTRITKSHGISGQKLHDMWVDKYKEVPDTWIMESSESFNGIQVSLEIQKDDEYVDDEDYDNQVVYVTATSNGKELGHVLFSFDGEYLMPQDLEVEERFRGQGIAQTMYDYVKSKGYKIRRSGQQTDAGAGFWDKHRPQQNVWEEDSK